MSRRRGKPPPPEVPDSDKPLADRSANPYDKACPIFGRPLIQWVAIAFLFGVCVVGPWRWTVNKQASDVFEHDVHEAAYRAVTGWCRTMLSYNWTKCVEQRNGDRKPCLKRIRQFLEAHLGPGPFVVLFDSAYELVSKEDQLVLAHGDKDGYNMAYDAEDQEADSNALLALMLHWEIHKQEMKAHIDSCSAKYEVLSLAEDSNGPFNDFVGEVSLSWPDPKSNKIATSMWVFDMRGKLREVPRDPRSRNAHDFRLYEFEMTYYYKLLWPDHREADD